MPERVRRVAGYHRDGGRAAYDEEPVMENANTVFVGLDVHKKAMTVARLSPDAAAVEAWEVPNEPRAIRRLASKLLREAGTAQVSCCYEAGVCGYALQRQLRQEGIHCAVVAPSLVPRKPGERIKTDHRDAKKLAEYWRSGMLTEVHSPSPEQEAVRDLVRCREDLKQDLLRWRHRLSKMLLRRALVYRTGHAWTTRHRLWLRGLAWQLPCEEAVFNEYLLAVDRIEERLRFLDTKLAEVAASPPYREPVGWLRCFRGIDTVTAMTIVAEIQDFGRFDSPRRFMAFLGLTPGEASSGQTQRRTGITKTGNAHVRRVLIEMAWHYRHRPAVGPSLRHRRQGQPDQIIALADRALRRLNARYQRLAFALGKPANKVVTALARELAGFLWAALVLTPNQTH
jgi:transposase